MTQSEVTQVYANYLPLLESGLIDQLVLITRNDISPSAKTYADTARGMVHVTYVDLLNSLLDFSQYCQGLIAQYYSDEVSKFYIPQTFRTESIHSWLTCNIAEQAIMSWIESDDTQPIALLAGYGMGKTTLAKRMACLLAERHNADSRKRIPVMIRLEGIGSEQSLEGLIGKHFTSLNTVRPFNFHLFMELNQRGRFVVFLDGFDEMKHAMSWETMRFNMVELNRLVAGNSKVVLGGRPSAFLSEEEYEEALHGRRRILEQWKEIPGCPDYQEFHLAPFSEEQIGEFVRKYMLVSPKPDNSASFTLPGSKGETELSAETRVRLVNLAGRPVQLKMLLEVLPVWDKGFDALTETLLYSEFIDLIIRREMCKLARQNYTLKERRTFVIRLARWMWTNRMGLSTSAAELPAELFQDFRRSDQDLDQTKREMLSAAFVEMKHPKGYYFPHRSFQEFLVAEALLQDFEREEEKREEELSRRIAALPTAASIPITRRFATLPTAESVPITREITAFFGELMGRKRFEQLIWTHRGELPDWFVASFLAVIDNPTSLLSDDMAMRSPWAYLILALGIGEHKWLVSNLQLQGFLQETLGSPPEHVRGETKRQWAAFFVILNIMLDEQVRTSGCDIDARISKLLRTASARMTSMTAANGKYLCEQSRVSSFCCLASWRQPWPFGDQAYSLGRVK